MQALLPIEIFVAEAAVEAAQVLAEEVIPEETETEPMVVLFPLGQFQSLVVSVLLSLLLTTFASAETSVETKHCFKKR